MSHSEIERFANDLKAGPVLRRQVTEGSALADIVAVAARNGYGFTLDEAKAFVKAKAKASGKGLSDAQLDGVAGGYHRCQIF
jgi:predicted ribosomally synthesized peptide with nif11-like leader